MRIWRKAALFGALLPVCAVLPTYARAQQINLNSNVPLPQVKGIVQPANGGLGLSSVGLTGCPKITAGVWTINAGNCAGGGGGTTYITAGTGIAITGSGTSSSPYVISVASTPPAFTITGFAGCSGALELGQTIANPTCTASYSTGATSASLTNTDNISSPTNLVSPYTSGTITGSFVHTAVATTTITLTASNGGSPQTATQQYSWNPAIFTGVGTPGATATVTASGTTAVLSTTDVLPRFQLGAETVGQSLGSFSPSGQAVYFLLTGGSHTFIDTSTGFPFAVNTPLPVTFVNEFGSTVTMYLYQSTNPLYGTFTPKVAS